jgi:hypothetical protein
MMDHDTDEGAAVDLTDFLPLPGFYSGCVVVSLALVLWPQAALFLAFSLFLGGVATATRLALYIVSACMETFLPSLLHSAIFAVIILLIFTLSNLITDEQEQMNDAEEIEAY